MTVEIELLTQPGCGPCIASKRMLSGLNVDVTYRNVQEDAEAAQIIRESRFTGTPVVIIDGELYHGTDRDAIYAAITPHIVNQEVLF